MAEGITELVLAAGKGDRDAYERLFAQVYGELKVLARKQLRNSNNPTLDTTGLVHDAYIKLAHPEALALSCRKHFFALAAKAMRQIVIDHARARLTDKRGNALPPVPLDGIPDPVAGQIAPEQLLALDRALETLQAGHPRLSALIELRFFTGLELEQIAAMQEVSERTLNRDWRRARAELYALLYG